MFELNNYTQQFMFFVELKRQIETIKILLNEQAEQEGYLRGNHLCTLKPSKEETSGATTCVL